MRHPVVRAITYAVLGSLTGYLLTQLRWDRPTASAEAREPSSSALEYRPRTLDVGSAPPTVAHDVSEEDAGAGDAWAYDPARPGHGPAPAYAPRAAHEWQGMLIDVSMQQHCERSDHCGLGLACRDERCGPCEGDADCEAGERCVLQHCLRSELVGCTQRADCTSRRPDDYCVLSEYSQGHRGNADMRSYCAGDAPQERPEDRVDPTTSAPSPTPVRHPGSTRDLTRRLLEAETR